LKGEFMSAATNYLAHWISIAQQRAPSATFVSSQRSTGVGLPPHWKPGIASYSWAINGTLVKDGSGATHGLQFGDIYSWFSDRGQDLNNPPPSGQQFLESNFDRESASFTINGDSVLLNMHLITWNSNWSEHHNARRRKSATDLQHSRRGPGCSASGDAGVLRRHRSIWLGLGLLSCERQHG
jgi:hypothetical protein